MDVQRRRRFYKLIGYSTNQVDKHIFCLKTHGQILLIIILTTLILYTGIMVMDTFRSSLLLVPRMNFIMVIIP